MKLEEQTRSSGMEASVRDGTQVRPVTLPGLARLPDGTGLFAASRGA